MMIRIEKYKEFKQSYNQTNFLNIILFLLLWILLFFNDNYTSFYVKYFELPLCMKCAI